MGLNAENSDDGLCMMTSQRYWFGLPFILEPRS